MISLPFQCLCRIVHSLQHTKDILSLEIMCAALQAACRTVELPPVAEESSAERDWDAVDDWHGHELGNSTQDWDRIVKLQERMARISSLRLANFWSLPTDLFAQATRLTCLELCDCLEDAPLPPSIVACTNLKRLVLNSDMDYCIPTIPMRARGVAQLPQLDDLVNLTLSTGHAYPELFEGAAFSLTSLMLSWEVPERVHM